jgi:dTDP-glucose 4,6-dehydratase
MEMDASAAIEQVFLRGEPGQIYNIGGGNERENIAVAEQIVGHLGKSRDLIRLVMDRPGHDRRYAVDCSKLRRLGWSPAVPFDEGLRATIQWYREHKDWWRIIKSGDFRQYYEQQYRRRLQEGVTGGRVKG